MVPPMKTRVMKNLKRVLVTAILAAGLGALTIGCASSSGGGPAVPAEKMAELEAQANKGDADAMLKLGDAHSKNKNYTEAKVWYDKAKAAFEKMKK